MTAEAKFFDIDFEGAGVRNSQKRLKSLIIDYAIQPLKQYQNELSDQFELVEDIILKRVADVIAYWAENKHDPVFPHSTDLMSEITNASKNDVTLEEFYLSEVKYAMYTLGPTFGLEVPNPYDPPTDELERALTELDAKRFQNGTSVVATEETFEALAQEDAMYEDDDYYDSDDGADDYYDDYDDDYDDDDYDDYDDYDDEEEEDEDDSFEAFQRKSSYRSEEMIAVNMDDFAIEGDFAELAELTGTHKAVEAAVENEANQERAIVSAEERGIEEVEQSPIKVDVLSISAEQAWQLIYGLIGYPGDYIQQTMLPRWQQYPDAFDRDRRFLYGLFIDTIRKSAGVQYISGNFMFADERMSVDQLWNHYFSDLSQNIAPQLAAARLDNSVNDPWWKRLRQSIRENFSNVSIIWLVALGIALIFDGLTTYVSLDQTPMDGFMVMIFTILITALFQIADQLVINYRRREFEAEALAAKYHAQFEKLQRSLKDLDAASDSFVQLSMEKTRAESNWKAAGDNRKMARRGRFWSARIADINVIVTAYGFAYMFLNSTEPMYALAQQIDYIFVKGLWENVDLWVFMMVGLAITVSFVVNTAQRTEILGWSMRSMKKEA